MIREEENEQRKRNHILMVCGIIITVIVCAIFLIGQIAIEDAKNNTDDLKRKEDISTISSLLSAYRSKYGAFPTKTESRTLYHLADITNDPDGTPYDFEVMTLSDGETKELSMFDHMVYITYHAKCENDTAVYTTSARSYAILYRLRNKATYCLDY